MRKFLSLGTIVLLQACGSGNPSASNSSMVGGVLTPGTVVKMAANPLNDYQTLQAIQSDLTKQPASSQAYMRYFTIEAWNNLGSTPVLVSADWERAALIKMLNFLSTAPKIVQPTPVDSGKFIYRVDMRDLNWTAAAWSNIKATDPYFNSSQLPSKYSTAASQTVRADWFVSNIPNSNIDAYFVFLGIDSDDPSIDAKNGVDRFGDMTKGAPNTYRGGITVSGTEDFNRLLTWHASNMLGVGANGTGNLFKSYNFPDDLGTHNIFSHPYEPTTNNPNLGTTANFDFDFADSDSISTLPNGLNFYYTTVADQGKVANVATTGAGFPGPTFCFQCHDTVTNMIPFTDQMHNVVASDPQGIFPAPLKTLLVGMYNQDAFVNKQMAAGATFKAAYSQLNLPVQESVGATTESCNVITTAYTVVLQVGLAAAELGVTPDQLVKAIQHSPSLASTLGSLIVRDADGVPSGNVRRDLWEASYNSVRALLFPQNQPAPSPSPSVSPSPSPTASGTPSPTPSTASTQTETAARVRRIG